MMIIRKGFVSNSSSSNFVVLFPKVPKSYKEVQKLLFGDKKTHHGYTTEEIAKCVYKDIKERGEATKIKLTPTIKACIEVDGNINLIMEKFFPEKDGEDNWEVYDYIESLLENGDIAGELKKKHGKGKIYKFGYADDCGDFWSMMEHSDIFKNLPHERISNH
jgi:flavodoxin